MEDPNEHTKELINHNAAHGGVSWISTVAVTTAILAVLAAISGLMASKNSNEAILEQIEASNQWNYFQAKGVKSSILSSKMELLTALDKKISSKDEEKLNEYKKEQDEIKKIATEKTESSTIHLHKHETLEKAVTLFQIAIAVGAISILTKRKIFFGVSAVFGIIGIIFLVSSFMVQVGVAH